VPYTVVEGGIAVVSVLGPLVARGDWLSALFGAIGYTDLIAAVAAALEDPAAGGVLLEIDSPGGEVAGLFDAVDLRQESGKPLHAIAREAALSAPVRSPARPTASS
jgi:capsid assembly protease